MRLKDRLREFMTIHGLSHRQMAKKLSTSYKTFSKWMALKENSTQPPACMLTLMDILERSSEARQIAGITRGETHDQTFGSCGGTSN